MRSNISPAACLTIPGLFVLPKVVNVFPLPVYKTDKQIEIKGTYMNKPNHMP